MHRRSTVYCWMTFMFVLLFIIVSNFFVITLVIDSTFAFQSTSFCHPTLHKISVRRQHQHQQQQRRPYTNIVPLPGGSISIDPLSTILLSTKQQNQQQELSESIPVRSTSSETISTNNSIDSELLVDANVPTTNEIVVGASSTTTAGTTATTNTTKLTSSMNQFKILKIIGQSTSFVVSGVFFTVLVLRRDAYIISFFIGSILNGILSKILKKVINQSRPTTIADNDTNDLRRINKLKPSDGGMPSSHGMSLGFISTFVIMNIPILTLPIIIYCSISLYYRIQIKLHTIQQIIVGTILGSMNGYIWYQYLVSNNNKLINWITTTLLNEHEKLPYPMLILPAVIGIATVGSLERRIVQYFKNKSKRQKES